MDQESTKELKVPEFTRTREIQGVDEWKEPRRRQVDQEGMHDSEVGGSNKNWGMKNRQSNKWSRNLQLNQERMDKMLRVGSHYGGIFGLMNWEIYRKTSKRVTSKMKANSTVVKA